MHSSTRLLSASCLIAVLAMAAPAPARAWSLFGSSPESKLLQRADEAYDAAMKARESGDALEELQRLQSARSAYQRLSDEYPTYRADHVVQRLDAAAILISDVSSSIESGASTIPDLAVGDRSDEPGAPLSTPDSADPSAPAFRTPIPVLVQTDGGQPGAAPERKPEPAPETDPALAAAIPNPFYRPGTETPDAPEAASAQPSGDEASATVEVTLHEARPAAVPPEEDLRDARVFLDMLREARATDAVLMLEDRIEEQGSAASLRTRVMYARALVQCANYRRASDVLAELPKEAEGDPAVRSLRAAVAVANDDLEEALLQLTLLLRDHSDYSDAYVDLAYVYHLLDPVGNRDAAIANYKAGLENGSKRDADLERLLDIRVGR